MTTRSSLERASGAVILASATAFSTLANLAFHFIMAKRLGRTDYASLAALIQYFTLCTAPLLLLRMAVSRRTAWMLAGSGLHATAEASKGWIRSSLAASAGVALMLALVSPLVASYLRLTGPRAAAIMGVGVGINVLLACQYGLLQGLHMMRAFSWNIANWNLLKLLFSLVAAGLGLGVFGVSGAIAGASVVVCLTAAGALTKGFADAHERETSREVPDLALWPLAVTHLSFALIRTADMMGAKHFLPGDDAGHYAAASMAAKILFILSDALTTLAYPYFAQLRARDRSTTRLLGTVTIVYFMGALAGMGVLAIFPGKLLGIMFGPDYVAAGTLVRILAPGQVLLGYGYILAHYFLARAESRFTGFLALGAMLYGAIVLTLPLDSIPLARAAAIAGAITCLPALLLLKREKRS